MCRFYTDNPVRDAENYQQFLENRDYITCDYCGSRIYKETVIFDGDIYYEIDGETVCENCIDDFVKRYERRYT